MKAMLQCILCSGDIGKEKWTNEFCAVFLKDNSACIGNLLVDKRPLYAETRSMTASDRSITLQIKIFNSAVPLIPTNAFLLHSSCLCLLEKVAVREIHPDQLFMLCQSLEPDRQRNFGFEEPFDLSCCLDPIDPIIPSGSVERFMNWELEPRDAISNRSALLQLPLEIMMMILKYLPPSALISFFCSSKQALTFTDIFSQQHQWHFYSSIDMTSTSCYRRTLMLAIVSEFSRTQYLGLDKGWELQSNVVPLAKHLCHIPRNDRNITTFNARAPFQTVAHSFGFQRLIARMPTKINAIEVHSRVLKGSCYVCGIGFQTGAGLQFFGNRSDVIENIDISHQINRIGFVTDSLGIRTLKFGESQWSSGSPEDIRCWEGLSRRRADTEIRIIQDSLKFRHISWCHDSPSFEEKILMRYKHPSSYDGLLFEADFVQQWPQRETDLVNCFGNFTTEAGWLDQDVSGITMFCDDAMQGIVGLYIHTPSFIHRIGKDNALANFFPLHGPHEVISEIDVRTHSEYLPPAITIKTNWNRQHLFGCALVPGTPNTIKTLQPPDAHYISGLYFRIGCAIESVGAIYAAGSRGSICHSTQPVPRMPTIDPSYEQENNFHVESCAALSGISKILFYHETGRCTGLRFFYHSGTSEVIGRIQGNHSREIALPNGMAIRRIWVVYREDKDDEQLENIKFETDNTVRLRERGNLYEVSESAAIAWWYSKLRDIIRIF